MIKKNNILIFAGAGASKAVASDLYPTTVEFFEKLPDQIKNNPLFLRVEEFLKQESENDPIDIELILWRLQELSSFCFQIQDQSNFSGWMLNGNRLSGAINSRNSNIGNLMQLVSSARGQLATLIGEINSRVYELYAELPSPQQLDKTWMPLLESLSKISPYIDIVTTNYDMVIESALENTNIVNNGWTGNVVRKLDTKLWSPDSENSKGLLTKLHGSVNWTINNDQIYVSDPNFTGSHDSHVIIYPGFKGKPNEGVFRQFHNYFRAALDSSSAVIFIGFAFRDDYINEICERSISSQKVVCVLNPVKIDLPFNSNRCLYLESGFDKKAASSIADYVGLGVNV